MTEDDSPPRLERIYHDYSKEDQLALEDHTIASGPGGDPPFPVKLHYTLTELKKDGLDHIISWMPHGRSFVVHDKGQFEENVLPYYFRQSRFSSFQRQLNLYGFQRITQGPDKGGYFSPLFLRGLPKLAARILRTKIKNNGPRKAASPSSEPKLYDMTFLPDPLEKQEEAHKATALEDSATQCPAGSSKKRFTQTADSLLAFHVSLGCLTRETPPSPTNGNPFSTSKIELCPLLCNEIDPTLARCSASSALRLKQRPFETGQGLTRVASPICPKEVCALQNYDLANWCLLAALRNPKLEF